MATLSSFDKELNEIIVKRGFEYYRKGRVKDIEQVEDGIWRALVEGSNVYDVKITLSDDAIKEHRCSCPYDLGEFCKHEIAALYAVRADIHGDTLNNEDKPIVKIKKKNRTARGEIEEIVGKFTEQELRRMIIEHALENEKLRRKILLAVPPSADSSALSNKDSYIDIIRSCMRENADHGFIGYYEARPASEAAYNLIEKAREYFAKEDYASAFPIGQAVIEAIYPELGSIDDSNGEFGECIEEAWNILQTIADKVPPTSFLGNELFAYSLSQVGKEIYDGWSIEDDFLSVAATLTANEARQKQLFGSIDQMLLPSRKKDDQYDSWNDEYKAENATSIKLKVLRQLGKNEEANRLIQEAIDYPKIRELYLEQLFAQQKFDEAKRIAKEGIFIAEKKGHSGISRTFEEWLCRIAEAEGDTPTVRKLLRGFFLDGRGGHEDYARLKKSFEHDELGWKQEYDYLTTTLKKTGESYALLDMCAKEQQWDDFLKYLLEAYYKEQNIFWPSNNKLQLLENYENILKERFPEKLIELYQKEIPQSLSGSAAGRAHYQYICRILRRMKKMGAEGTVEKMKENFCSIYGNRKALIDELSKV
ncbi:SWIM zinc finger family protein [Candidatus Peregrinibacteria bacterium]|nr:SWIM zinc finger family protein [Candidatus Peregrinibacteria bacterium]